MARPEARRGGAPGAGADGGGNRNGAPGAGAAGANRGRAAAGGAAELRELNRIGGNAIERYQTRYKITG